MTSNWECDLDGLADFTITCADTGSIFRTGRIFLAAASPYFEQLIVADISGITLGKDSFRHLEKAVRLATMKTPMDISGPCDLAGVAIAAENFKMEDVMDKILELLATYDSGEVLEILLLLGKESKAANYCTKFLARNIQQVLKTQPDRMLSLTGYQLAKILSRSDLDIADEIDVWKLVKKWAEWSSNPDPAVVFKKLLSSVRFSLIPEAFFLEHIMTDPWLLVQVSLGHVEMPKHVPETARILRRTGRHMQVIIWWENQSLEFSMIDVPTSTLVRMWPQPQWKKRDSFYISSVVASPFHEGRLIISFNTVYGPQIHWNCPEIEEIVEIDLEDHATAPFQTFSLVGLPGKIHAGLRSKLLAIKGSLALVLKCWEIHNFSVELMGTLYMYDREHQRWNREDKISPFAYNSIVAGDDGHLYTSTMREVKRLNIVTGTFEVIGELLEERYDSSCFWWKSGIVFAFGHHIFGNWLTIEHFDPNKGISRLLTAFPHTSMSISMHLVDVCPKGESHLIVALTTHDAKNPTLFEYDSNQDSWRKIDILLPWDFGHIMALKRCQESAISGQDLEESFAGEDPNL